MFSDRHPVQVLATAGHVALYVFDTEKKAWVSSQEVPHRLLTLSSAHSPGLHVCDNAESQGCRRILVLIEKTNTTSLQDSDLEQKKPG